MISRRQIIRGQPASGDQRPVPGGAGNAGNQQQVGPGSGSAPSSSSSSSSSKPSMSQQQQHHQRLSKMIEQQQAKQQQQQQQLARQQQVAASASGQAVPKGGGASMAAGPAKSAGAAGTSAAASKQKRLAQQAAGDSSDGYLVTSSSNHPYEEYVEERNWRQMHPAPASQQQVGKQSRVANNQQQQQQQQQQQDGNNEAHRPQAFDPYSIYSDEEDVWYSEERLFEDHLEEIYNKWPLLDDDIWCKLIVMERNRRVGKAYARVPVVTINGSRELSYDGEKLALNGFDNIDRDEETEECRKRIGKGFKIKVDNIGNILIKRLSKAGVYVKEWINPSTGVSGGSSNSTNGSCGNGVGRSMPSRQQLIKAASMNGVGGGSGNHMSSLMAGGTPTSSSGGSSMDIPNDSAICDEVISIGGRLDLDKIYVMFDIKKFQANITQELCRPYPDRRKLEQQCFSIVGLTRDSEDILNLPVWMMIINIVAIEMLNARFPQLGDRHGGLSDFPDSRRLLAPQAPSFVSIFDQHPGNTSHRPMKDKNPANNKEEDPYSLPANASSSDVKSSINDYGTASTTNMSNYIENTPANHPTRFYGNPKNIYPPTSRPRNTTSGNSGQGELMQRHRSKSNYNIYGQTSRVNGSSNGGMRYTERYNNNNSIYSPGHMLVPPLGDHSVPPKLPPRDFVAKKATQKSKSSSNVNHDDMNSNKYDDQSENIYSTGLIASDPTANGVEPPLTTDEPSKVVRKAKKNRFLESLKSPLAKSGRSSSVLGTPSGVVAEPLVETKKTSKSKGGFSKAKNLRSFLGVGSKSTKESTSDDSNYAHLDETTKLSSKSNTRPGTESAEADSVVDSNEDIDDSHQVITNSTTSPTTSYNDLDIPTPDYETDENIYALEDGAYPSGSGGDNNNPGGRKQHNGGNTSTMRTRRYSTSNNMGEVGQMKGHQNKDDLYYSGYRAHVPHHHHHHHHHQHQQPHPGSSSNGIYQSSSVNNRFAGEDRMSRFSQAAAAARGDPGTTANSRYLMRTSRMLAAKMSGREIYGSTLGLQQQQPSLTGSRYRSASMQRYYPTSRAGNNHLNRSHNEMYDPEIENPYAMSAGLGSSVIMPLDDTQGHYGVTTAASCIGGAMGGAGRRRSVSKLLPVSNRSVTSSTNHYDIGRSSSGIYGNNSSSSSSEYADWHPQVRKGNSSGYLNSIFKSHQLNNNNNNNNSKTLKTTPSTGSNMNAVGPTTDPTLNNNNGKANHGGYDDNQGGTTKPSSQVRNYASSRMLNSTADDSTSVGTTKAMPSSGKKQQQQQIMNPATMDEAAYRAYDSSNDSDPSYTNSSDGLDIYDQIGAHPRIGGHQQHPAHHHHRQNQFMAPEVQVGEWEDMYDR